MRALTATLTLAAALGLSACTADMAQNRMLDSVHQPVISRTNYTLDLDASGGSLAPSEQQRLAEWFDAMQLGYGDRIALDEAGGPASRAVRDLVEAVASRHGLTLSDGAPVTNGALDAGNVRVVVTRSTADVPGCPDWSSKLETNFRNATSSNFGCATSTNIARMVANPEDLVRGEPGSGAVATSGSDKAIRQYRNAPPSGAKGLKESSTQQSGGNQ